MNKQNDRVVSLLEILRAQGTVSVQDLSSKLGVSLMTIRRDLQKLQDRGMVTRSHGKATMCKKVVNETYKNIDSIYSLSWARTSMYDEKLRIAKYAASLIEPGDVIILDNGSTTDLVADYIPPDIDLTIACYNLNILAKVANRKNTEILFGGGYFQRSDQMFVSSESILFLESIRAHKLFLSACGVHPTLGMTCAHDFEVGVKRTVIDSSLKTILVADSSKFGAVRTEFFETLDAVDMIITDVGISLEQIEIIREKGIELALV